MAAKKKRTEKTSREEKEELLKALQELEDRKAAAPLLYYNPHDKQAAFHEAGKTYRRRLFLGANRSGKTYGGSREALGWALGYRYWEIEDLALTPEGDLPPREDIDRKHWVKRADGVPVKVPNLGICLTGLNTRRGIGEVIWPALRDAMPKLWLEETMVKVSWGPNQTPQKLQLPNGSIMSFDSRDQDPITFEGVECDWAWIDEPVPAYCYNGIWRGLSSTLGSLWITLTPLGAHCRWMYFDLYKKDEVWRIEVALRDNKTLSNQMIEEFESNLTGGQREKAARTKGHFEFLGNAVFPNFERDTHIVKAFPIEKHWIRGCTIDPHHRKAAFILWWAVDPETAGDPVYHFYREWPEQDYYIMEGGGKTYSEYAALIRGVEGADPSSVRIVDPRFGKAEFTIGGRKTTCWVEEMAQCGLHFDARVPNIQYLETGHSKVSEMLKYDHNFAIGPTNTPKIFIHDTCPNTIKGIENYGYLEVKSPELGVVEKVSEEFKEPIDCIRYTVLYPLPRNDLMTQGGQSSAGTFSLSEFIEYNQEN